MNLSGDLAKTLLELAPDATVVVEADGTIVFANARMEQTFGYTAAELTGVNVDTLLPPRLRTAHAAHRAQFNATPRPRPMGRDLTLLGLHKNGSEFPVEISLSPVPSGAGKLIVAAIRDATARREAERQLIEANRAKSRLLAAASHDLRQPVQTLNLLNRAAVRHAGTNAALLGVLERQQLALDTMGALLTSVLDISKLDSGAVKPEVAARPIAAIFDRLRSDYEPQAADKGLELRIEATTEGGFTDAELLRRLLGNLIANAIRYTLAGRIDVLCQRRGDTIDIVVRDTGIGIPTDQIERIFEEFYQVDQSTQKPEGLGLGLSIVRRLARLLNASLRVESEPGRGTAFTVSLPWAEVVGTPAAAERADAVSANNGRVLVVDDERAVAEATGLLLELEGFDVRIASCEREALEHAGAAPPDIIVSDYHLRGGDTGLEVVRAIRDRLHADVPAIFVTGDTGKLDRARLGNAHFLSKPIRADELVAAIHDRLGPRAAERAQRP
jgi:PAS domain S-box-containing protein